MHKETQDVTSLERIDMRHIPTIFLIIILVIGCAKKDVNNQDSHELTPLPLPEGNDGNPPKIGTVRPLDEGARPVPLPRSSRPVKVKRLSETPTSKTRPHGSRNYTVKNGDTYWNIAARQLGDGKRWPEIEKLNPKEDRKDLKIGQVIFIPVK